MTDLHNSYANARDKNIPLEITPVTGTRHIGRPVLESSAVSNSSAATITTP